MNNMAIQLAKHLAQDLLTKPEYALTRDGYGHGVVEVAEKDPNVAVLCCDLTESTRSHWFREKFPERFIEVGVAEQNMAGIAAGMAAEGYIPFISSYAVFSPGRNWDQIRVSLCYSNTNVKVMGAHAGISVGPDGATHQALEDMAIMRVLPNMVVLAPCDREETRKAIHAAAVYDGPVYIRFAREKTAVMTTPKSPFAIGKAEVFAQGSDVTLIACGPLVYEALHAAQLLLKYHIRAEVINMPSLKPFDEKTLLASVKKTGCAVTVEEHQIIGGLFGAVAEVVAQTYPVPVIPVGMHDTFGQSGTPDELLKLYGMRAQNIVAAARAAIKKR